MTEDELAAVIAAASAILTSRTGPTKPARSAWQVAARLGRGTLETTRARANAPLLWKDRDLTRG